VDSAVSLLTEYNNRLHNELEDRKKMAIMLRDFIEHQKEQVEKGKQKLEVSECFFFFSVRSIY
jgi:regulator of Ty1 transposition protein 103